MILLVLLYEVLYNNNNNRPFSALYPLNVEPIMKYHL